MPARKNVRFIGRLLESLDQETVSPYSGCRGHYFLAAACVGVSREEVSIGGRWTGCGAIISRRIRICYVDQSGHINIDLVCRNMLMDSSQLSPRNAIELAIRAVNEGIESRTFIASTDSDRSPPSIAKSMFSNNLSQHKIF
jgi:hypothetical protein